MTAKDYPSLWGYGATKTFNIPVEHLDFKYIEKCSDIKYLEKILYVLRSGEEGYYPELTEFCEKRLQGLAPGSRALRKDKPAATASSFTTEEWEEIDGDIKSWVAEIKTEETRMHFQEPETFPGIGDHLPPVRGSNNGLHVTKEKYSSKNKSAKKKIPRDYAEWDKFDVEKECSKIDEDYKEKTIVDNKSHLSKIETRIDIAGLTEKEKGFLATREKEKGNEAFNSGDYEEAVMYYTRSISVLPTVAAYNNRAQAEIKLQNWNNAFQDCEKVLKLEPGNIKALLRRATTYKHQNKLQEAIEDLRKVLEVEPDHDLAKKTLSEVERNLKNYEPTSKPQTKGKRMVIEEVENSEDENGKRSGTKHEDGSGDKTSKEKKGCVGGSGDVAQHTCNANTWEFGAGGSWAKASLDPASKTQHYTANKQERSKISNLAREPGPASPGSAGGRGRAPCGSSRPGDADSDPAGSESADEVSILYSNRAACYLKEGNCRGCIRDCNRALELHPFSIKPLLRRAMAYETLEQYGKAYVDYKTVLQMDSGIQLANDSINRITRILMALDGPNWREKLSPIPMVPTSEPLRTWCPVSQAAPNQAGDPGSCTTSSISDEEMFKALKEEGNQYAKDKNYKKALSKYTECLQICSEECAIYTNRQVALCYLKLCQFEEAKQDCDQALRLDGRNVKACYRRALAHKALKNYQESLTDLNKVLLLNPNIAEAKMELEEVTRFLKDNTAPFNKEKERRKIEIQEVNEGSEEEPEENPAEVSTACLASEKGDESTGPPEHSESLQISKPINAYEFGQVINAINTRKDEEACAHLLAITGPKDLPVLLSNKLEGDTFLLLIQSLKNHLIAKDPALVYHHLLYLSKADRFKMILTLINKHQKEQIEQLLNELSDIPNNHFTLEDVQVLKDLYEL
ncbi:Sperm-associated antigen 1 [Heterocephalus glaber]|uniref:Sperm-associated antigen 1 n=1 Tax=Heterocephalus glaber TaxID=10181 RepID=G5ANZ4_HETGA|nr:Sperm-associated antigen 1 [Heterocephalus glaber]